MLSVSTKKVSASMVLLFFTSNCYNFSTISWHPQNVLAVASAATLSISGSNKKTIAQRLQWSIQLPDVETKGAPAKHNGIAASRDGSTLYMTTNLGFLYGVDAKDGRITLTHEPFPWTKTTESKPVLCEKIDPTTGESFVEYVVYAISDGRVIAVNVAESTGTERWMMYSEYCTPTQPTMDATCDHVYYTCNKRHKNESELFVVNDEQSKREFMGVLSDRVTRLNEKLGPVSLGSHGHGVTRSMGAKYVYFGSYKEEEDDSGADILTEKDSNNRKRRKMLNEGVFNGGGKTLRYNSMSRSLEEMKSIGTGDGVKAPLSLSHDESYMWARTYDEDTNETILHGLTTRTLAEEQQNDSRSTNRMGTDVTSLSSSSSWQQSLGMSAQELNHAPILSPNPNEQAMFAVTEKALYKVATTNGNIRWSIKDLNLKASPILHPGRSTSIHNNGRRLQTRSNTLYVMEDTGGRIWKINTETGEFELELNCIESATCAMASHADFTTSPDGNVVYIALKSGIVYAVETTEPFTATDSDFPGTPTDNESDGNGDNSSTDGSAAWSSFHNSHIRLGCSTIAFSLFASTLILFL